VLNTYFPLHGQRSTQQQDNKMYLHRTTIYKNISNVIGAPVDNDVNKTDFETNHKSSVVPISAIELFETTFLVDKTYAGFEALLTGDISWTDVKMIDNEDEYILNLLLG